MGVTRGAAVLVCCVFLFGVAPASAQSFFDNYLRPEYLVPVTEFPAASGGDLYGSYFQVPIPSLPNGELLIIGEFPRARYFSITAYDDHGAIIGKLDDFEIHPFGSVSNPYQPGGPAGAEDILYAVTMRLGVPSPPNPLPQCQSPISVTDNVLDATIRHTATNFYSNKQRGFSANVSGYGNVTHDDTVRTTGTFVLIRSYGLMSPLPSSTFDLRKPLVWVRAADNGCAVQLAPAGQYVQPSQWFTLASVLRYDQVYAHQQHEVDLGYQDLYGPDPRSAVGWTGREEYLPGQAFGRYVSALLPVDGATLKAQGRVLQLQFRLPVMPCRNPVPCPLTGNEDLRYWSLTFEDSAGRSVATVWDLSLATNASGYVTPVFSFGLTLPSYVNSANGYSPSVAALATAKRLVLRNFLPAALFGCSTANVPPRTAEYTPNGGYMGEFAPVISFPFPSALPTIAQPLMLNDTCAFP